MKPKACKVCRSKFVPARAMQSTCGVPCALAFGRAQLERKQAREAKAERAKDKAKRETLKTRSDWIKETQIAFNRFVRLRDASRPCISCGVPLASERVGGGFDAGHYRSTGSAPHLRFHEWNCHGQCKQCNRYGSGRAVDYRIGLVERIGLDSVDALEADQTPRKWTVDELRVIRDTYRAKSKQLEKETA